MKSYYFCNTHMAFSHDCQIVNVYECDNMEKMAKQWALTNGYKTVYVYDMNHNFVWSYSF